MKRNHLSFLGGLAVAVAALIFTGCASTRQASGSKLWAQNCTRCHNNRSPASFSEAQWEVALTHMRIRANLTAEEHKSILEFLKTAN